MGNNKYYSNRQESMIADYLGWKQVSGSGARPFAPGDVNADHWLGECKTHDILKDNIVFLKRHWFKIAEEARERRKYPVLFTDNGSQKVADTWVLMPCRLIDSEQLNVIGGLKNTSTKGTSLTFNKSDADLLYRQGSLPDKWNVFTISWDDTLLAVLPLSTYRDFIEDYF